MSGRRRGKNSPVLGPILIVLTILFVLPISFMFMGAVVSFLFGWSLTTTAEADNAGSELIDTNY